MSCQRDRYNGRFSKWAKGTGTMAHLWQVFEKNFGAGVQNLKIAPDIEIERGTSQREPRPRETVRKTKIYVI